MAARGFVYIPAACAGAEPAACLLHVVFHGCDMSSADPLMNATYALHARYNAT